ncbi:Sec-independent protein translocase TatB [Isoptericola sp. b441]|uniref:Sec-independent protein translocase TatB n=1 Tax=Actinotalea lenta TaxID=3064654 RepID=A0ABT9D7Q7_9CELL|nr:MULTISPECIES: Sec-independent protein translocase TatB [unclassified Isoptericola]MDO8106895.1 Sec-independent protein translocase TatB [Isoptericola sp. b441]MDO8121394.1 Sec-independent protein translocase TatB [Isoptericola sp. b490]
MINPSELLVLLVLAAVVVGPERLPRYAAQLGRLVRDVRAYLATARERVVEETGLDWEELDPRRYDPRRIVREALEDEPARKPHSVPLVGPAPFDDEAT